VEEEVTTVTTPEQFKALGHPARHRLLFALGQRQATISQLAAGLHTNKGNVAHHLKVLSDAGLVRVAGTRTVRGGTEQYYERTFRTLEFTDPAVTGAAFAALSAEVAGAQDPFLVMRTLNLTAEHAGQLAALLKEFTEQPGDTAADHQYRLLVGFYQLPAAHA
jgi:DNA-binding transcriptional ArsR family regulator